MNPLELLSAGAAPGLPQPTMSGAHSLLTPPGVAVPPVVPQSPQSLDPAQQAKLAVENDKDKTPPPGPITDTQFYVNHIVEFRKASDTARTPHKTKWDVCWDLFTNNYDFSKKLDWQSKSWVPKIPTLIRATAATIKRALLSSRDIGAVDGYGPVSKQKARMMQKLVMWAMSEGKFVDQFVEALMAGLATPGVNIKIYPKSIQIDTSQGENAGPANASMTNFKNTICFEAVSEYELFRDPTGSNKYIIHRIEMDLADLKAQAANPANGYDPVEVAKIQQTFDTQAETYEKAIRAGNASGVEKPSIRKRVKIEEYWGIIYSQDGTIKMDNGTMSLANEQFLIRAPMKNPYDHGKPPIISAFPAKVPFSTWHEAFVWAVTGLARTLNDVMNLSLDGFLSDSVKAYEVDIDILADPEDIANGIYPGKGIKKQGNESIRGGNLITPIEMGHMKPEQQLIYGTVSGEFRNGAGTSEFSTPQLANPGKRGDATATQVREESAAAEGFSNDLAQTLEREMIEPAIKMTSDLLIQFFNDFRNPAVVDILGDDALILATARTDEERKALMGGSYYTTSKAITGLLKKTETFKMVSIVLDKLAQFAAVLPPMNIPSIANIFLDSASVDPKDIFIDPNPAPVAPPAAPPSPLAQILIQQRAERGEASPLDSTFQPPALPPNAKDLSIGALL